MNLPDNTNTKTKARALLQSVMSDLENGITYDCAGDKLNVLVRNINIRMLPNGQPRMTVQAQYSMDL